MLVFWSCRVWQWRDRPRRWPSILPPTTAADRLVGTPD